MCVKYSKAGSQTLNSLYDSFTRQGVKLALQDFTKDVKVV